MFPLEKYTYIVTENKVRAVQTYAGLPYIGVAQCAPQDQFDFETGKELAAARCNAKIARARHKHARKCFKEAEQALIKAKHRYDKYKKFCSDAYDAMIDAECTLEELEEANGVEI